MARTPNTAEGSAPVARQPQAVPIDALTAYENMLDAVPDATGDGIEGILDQLARADSAQGLSAPWDTNGLGAYVDERLMVTGIRKSPSEHPGPIGFYLIVDAASYSRGGELVTVTTGSISVVAQLVRAHALDLFPLLVIPRLAKRPTKDGFYPMHLEIPKP